MGLLVACGGGGGGSGGSTAGSASQTPPTGPVSTISGSIAITQALAADYDTRDAATATDLRNNPQDPEQTPGWGWPQHIEENPVRIAGHVKADPGGLFSASVSHTDPDDYFRMVLRAGQIVSLAISDPITADLDLYLFDATGEHILDGSLGVGDREELVISEDQEYVIDVSAYSGGSGYVLSVIDPVSGASVSTPSLSGDFAADELLVEVDDGVDSASMRRREATHRFTQRVQLWRLGRGMSRSAKRALLVNGLKPKFDTLMQLKAVAREAGVRRVEPNFRIRASAMPNDTDYHKQWHYPLINLADAWDMTTGARPGDEVIVAVVDTGILIHHPDLEGQLLPGYDFVANVENSLDGDGIDPLPEDPVVVPQASLGVTSFHGTHVAGTIAAASNNDRGVAGVAWHAKIMPIRVLGEGSSGTVYDVLQGVRYAAGLPNDSGTVPEKPADIINLSLTGTVHSEIAEGVYAAARAAGSILVAAGGNNGTSQPVYPASYPGVIGVGAVGANALRLPYSSYGFGIDVVAPGGIDLRDENYDGYPDLIYSTQGNPDTELKKPDYGYGYKSGTSMSAAQMSGVVALMEAVDPDGDLTPVELDQLLQSGELTQDLGAPGRDDYYGYGLIDAYKAVLAAAGGVVAAPPVLDVAPRGLHLGMQLHSAEFTLFNAGGGELQVTEIISSVDWLNLQTPATDLGTYTVTVDREQLDPGDHVARLEINSSAGPLTLAIAISQPSAEQLAGRDAGTLHIYLYDVSAGTEVLRREVTRSARDGSYSFNFSGVEQGRSYRIRASTDHDNDGDICDEGEACASSDILEDLAADLAGLELDLELR